ncbi:hypothetical protein LOK49_LG13G01018 [Camellia lanceoleosa]|uniref:Uncharacterized protein n=1 Tax=Camellia lanceoleosa TaxID=1840588 RepID=A0ACC0FHE9_9ERIC|nr:hypothetical protein LOK49_LG13G01018 [Camellia lanceoleosa]
MNHLFGLMTILSLIYSSAMAEPPCGTVLNDLTPCLPYLMAIISSPSEDCCNGAKDIGNLSQSNNDLTDICDCIVSAVNAIGGIHASLVPPLPRICGLQFNLPPLSNCSKSLSNNFHSIFSFQSC